MIGVAVALADTWRSGEAPALRHATASGSQLFALSRAWLAERPDGVTGLYHALGDESRAFIAAGVEFLRGQPFDAMPPAASMFRYSTFGPAVSLAVAASCRGPFVTLDGGPGAALWCLAAALGDLEAGRIDRALLTSVRPPDEAWVLGLTADAASPALTFTIGATPSATPPAPGDPHGLVAVTAALRARRTVEIVAGTTRLELVWT